MKKILVLIIAAVLCIPTINAQTNSKALQKALKKEYTLKKKEFKKGGWELFASTRSMDVALLQHYDKLAELGENGREVVGIASRFKSKNVGYQQAINNACINYAQQAGSTLKGRIVSDMASNADDTSSEFDHFYAAYERLVEKEIKGELVESFCIIRCVDKKNSEFEMMAFFIVDESAATRARIRAMENALKESEAAQKYANKVSEFVQEGFK